MTRCTVCNKNHLFVECVADPADGFTSRMIAEVSHEEAAKWDPIRDVYRGNCLCGKWLVIPSGFTRERPLICGGPCGQGIECGRAWFWEGGIVKNVLPPVSTKTVQVSRPSFESIYMELAHALSARSTCARTQVGAVVVTPDFSRVLAVGYNGGPRGGFNECLSEEPGQCQHLHAEMNALLKMDYGDSSRKIMMVTRSPCFNCAVAIVNARIDEIIYDKEYRLTDGIDLLRKSGISVRKQARDVQVDEDR